MKSLTLLIALLVLSSGCKECPDCPDCTTAPEPGATSSAIATTSSTVTAPKPQVPSRSKKLPHKTSKIDAEKAIKAQDNPIRVAAKVEHRKGRSGVRMNITNTTDKEALVFSGFIYGFNRMDEPENIALGGKFTTFISLENITTPPGESAQWYKSFYKLEAGTTALVEITKIKYVDGTTWNR